MLSGLETAPPDNRVLATMDERDDGALLRDLATRRDSSAFDLLFSRYERTAYNVAYSLTRSHELAEEAVQETFLDLWRTKIVAQDNPRNWIVRIVAHKSIDLIHGKARQRRLLQECAEATDSSTAASSEWTEKTELLTVLRQMLERLSTEDRRLLALYYAGGLTYAEIAHDVSMPLPTVAFRIQKALETLRSNLTKAGFASAAPLLGLESLREAFCDGIDPPAGLHEKVSGMVRNGAQVSDGISGQAQLLSRRGAAAGVSSECVAWSLFAAVLASAVGGMIWWSASSRQPTPLTTNSNEVAKSTSALEAQPEAALLHHRWTFEAGLPKDLQLLKGNWSRQLQAGGNQWVMEVPGEAWVLLPAPAPAGPFLVSFKFRVMDPQQPAFWSSLRVTAEGLLPGRQTWPSRVLEASVPHKLYEHKCFFIGAYEFSFTTDIPKSANAYQDASAFNRLCVGFKNAAVMEIELRELRPNEIPTELKDPQRFIEALKIDPVIDSPEHLRPRQ